MGAARKRERPVVHGRHVAFRSSSHSHAARSSAPSAARRSTPARPDRRPDHRCRERAAPTRPFVRRQRRACATGARAVRGDTLLRSSMLISFGVVMVMGSFRGLVLPVHFTAANSPSCSAMCCRPCPPAVCSQARSAMRRSPTSCAAAPGTSCRSPAWPWAFWAWAFCPRSPLLIASALMLGLSARPISALLRFLHLRPHSRRKPRESALRDAEFAHLGRRACGYIFAISLVVEGAGVSVAAWPSPAVGCSSPCGPSIPTA